MNIIGKHFTANGFAAYAPSIIKASKWQGEFIVLHNTGSPTIAQRPEGLTLAHVENLKAYYESLGWHAGPHLFCDQNGIWVFSPLSAPGVHSPSWNSFSYGVEQLGDFDTENYSSGPGAKIRGNAIAAMAVIARAAGIDSQSIRLHKTDPLTDHKDCPGEHCASQIEEIRASVHEYIVNNLRG
jgi:hypothetical protein